MKYEHNERASLRERILLWLVPVAGALFALSSVASMASESEERVFSEETSAYTIGFKDRWGFAYENDFFVPGGNDRDYTFGLAYSYSSSQNTDSLIHKPLSWFDRAFGLGEADRVGYEAGLYGFTPEEKYSREVIQDDRPFSSLVYFSISNEHFDPVGQSVIRTQVSLGALGLDLVGDLQSEFHSVIGNEEPEGWGNQISDGGELTARYVISKQNLIGTPSNRFELRTTKTASVGYLTEASVGLSMRAGNLNSSWHDFNPDVASYAESSASANRGVRERFFWAGFAIKGRAYNAFLQGQFKDSVHQLDSDEVKHVIAEYWAGYTQSFQNGFFVSYGLRGHTSEVREGNADRSVLWGGLMLGRKTI